MSNIYEAVMKAAQAARDAAEARTGQWWEGWVAARREGLPTPAKRTIQREAKAQAIDDKGPDFRRGWAEMKRQAGGFGLQGGLMGGMA